MTSTEAGRCGERIVGLFGAETFCQRPVGHIPAVHRPSDGIWRPDPAPVTVVTPHLWVNADGTTSPVECATASAPPSRPVASSPAETRAALIDAMLEARKQRYLHPWAPGTERAFRGDCERELAAVLPLVADAIEARYREAWKVFAAHSGDKVAFARMDTWADALNTVRAFLKGDGE